MTEEDALIQGVLEAPEDRTARLVLADWLDEHGSHEQAELIRLRCALADSGDVTGRRLALYRRALELADRHKDDWAEVCHLPLTWGQALAVFRRRLAETSAWCARADGRLRSPSLRPPRLGRARGDRRLWDFPSSERQDIVNRLATRRARLLAQTGWTPEESADTPSGRLLIFYPDLTLCDGAAEAECERYFDGDNMPAWDTWVFATEDAHQGQDPVLYHSFMVSWVPPELVRQVDAGIRVNPEECIRWLADVDTALTRKLREAGLLC